MELSDKYYDFSDIITLFSKNDIKNKTKLCCNIMCNGFEKIINCEFETDLSNVALMYIEEDNEYLLLSENRCYIIPGYFAHINDMWYVK